MNERVCSYINTHPNQVESTQNVKRREFGMRGTRGTRGTRGPTRVPGARRVPNE